MRTQSYLIGLCLLVIVAGVVLLFAWPNDSGTELAFENDRPNPQSGNESSSVTEQRSSRTRVDLEASKTATAGSEDPDELSRAQSSPLGWLVVGTVSGIEEDPIANAEISLHYWGLPDSNVRGPAVTTSTDEEGSFQIFVPIPKVVTSHAPSSSFPGLIAGRAGAAGYLPARTDSEGGITGTNHPSLFMPLLAQPMPEAEASRVRIDFVLKAGSVVRGRVVSADGTPVEQAIVNIKDPERDWHLGGATDYDGLYSIPIESTGEHQISAEKRSLGLASAISFAADANRDIDLPDIVLKGTDCLSGTVVFPDGTPIEGVEIYAYMEKPREKRTRPTSIEAELSRRRDASHKDLLGCTQGEAITDRDGSFTIRGLHPGQYKVTPRTLHDFMGTEEMDTDHLSQMHDSGTAHIGFILPIHLIHARMRDEEGRSLPGFIIFEIGFSRGELSAGDSLTEETTAGSVLMQALPGAWTVWGFTNGRYPVKQRVAVGERDHLTEVDLVIPGLELSGRLCLSVKGTDGKAIDKISVGLDEEPPRSEAAVHFDNFLPLYRESLSSETGEYDFAVPSGSFRVSVAPRGSSTVDGAVYSFSLYHGTSLDKIEIVQGETTHSSVTLQLGGLVRLIPRFDRSGSNHVTVQAKAYDETRGGDAIYLGFAVPGSTNRIRPSEIESGVPYVGLKLLRPGSYRLEVRTRGYPKKFIKTEIPFTILPGKVTDVEAWIEEE